MRTEMVELTNLCMIKDGDKYLLQNRVKKDWQGYTFPGGHIEPGESIVQSAIREVKEETGITVKNIRYTGSQAWPYPDQLMLAFCCEYESGEIIIQEDELEDARWFDMDNLPEIPPPGSVAYNLIHHRWG